MGLVAGLVALAALLYCTPIYSFDIWWHLKLGEMIVQEGAVPDVDVLSYASFGRPYLDQHWGFQVVAWSLFWLGGMSLLSFAKAAVGAGAVTMGVASRTPGTPAPLVVGVWMLPVFLLSSRMIARPELVTLLSLASTLWILHNATRHPRCLLLLPVQQVIAINCHAVAIVNVVVMAIYVVDRVHLRWRASRNTGAGSETALPGPSPAFELGVLGGMAAAGLISPYGFDGWAFPFHLFLKTTLQREFWSAVSTELRSPLWFVRKYGWMDFYSIVYFAILVLGVGSFLFAWRDRRFNLYRLLLFGAFAYLSLNARRNLNLFALVAGVVMTWNFADVLLARPQLRRRIDGSLCRAVAAIAMVAIGSLVVTSHWHRWVGRPGGFGLGELSNWYIHGPAAFAGGPGMPERAFVAQFGQAGVYVFHNGPDRRPFLDGRLEHPHPDSVRAYFNAVQLLKDAGAMARSDNRFLKLVAPRASGAEEWPAIVLDTATRRDAILALAQNPTWRCVFLDRTGAVFVAVARADRLGLRQVSMDPLLSRGRDVGK